MKHLLIIDDERGSRESMRLVFLKTHQVTTAENSIEALDLISKKHFDLIILDVVMPGMTGMEFLHEVREIFPEIPVIMVSASYNDDIIQEAKHLKAVGFICKPFDVHELRNLVNQTLEASEASRQQHALKMELSTHYPSSVIGNSAAIGKAIEEARKAAQTNSPVLILGEVGSGRELLARQIHSWSNRGASPFFKVECSRFNQESIETELLGVALNPITNTMKSGVVDFVGNGTLYLDEIQTLPTQTHVLLRDIIQREGFQRPGSPGKWIPHVARFIMSCTSSRQNQQKIASVLNEFGSCVNAHTICIPALHERKEDIPMLVIHYMNQFASILNSSMCGVEPEALQQLQQYPWPGNVRELRNVLERILVLHSNEPVLKREFLPPEINGESFVRLGELSTSFTEATDTLHRQLIVSALKKTNGVVKNAASLLEVTPRILQHRMDKLKIDFDRP
jgi:DNA-binding NtrC family response regulator